MISGIECFLRLTTRPVYLPYKTYFGGIPNPTHYQHHHHIASLSLTLSLSLSLSHTLSLFLFIHRKSIVHYLFVQKNLPSIHSASGQTQYLVRGAMHCLKGGDSAIKLPFTPPPCTECTHSRLAHPHSK